MTKDNRTMVFSVIKGDHVLKPQNKEAAEAQNAFFEILEEKQKELIDKYNALSNDEKSKHANLLADLFVMTLMNGDQASFKALLGSNHKLMNAEELKNIKNDFIIAKRKKSLGEYKTFLLLDLFPYSNRRADAIIINNEYQLELYDFSEGVIAEKLKNYTGDTTDLKDGEIIQLKRKTKQQERINSFQNKIKMDSHLIEDVVLDDKKINIVYYCNKPKLFDFNFAYDKFLEKNRERVYIPNSLCFLAKENEEMDSDFFTFSLKTFIDHPYFSVSSRNINRDFINDIYKNNTNIIFSRYYFFFFFERFTSFEVIFRKRIEENQVKVRVNGKIKGLALKDSRTNNCVSLSYPLLFKHAFMNMSLMSWCEYLSAICNQTFEDKIFNQQSFYKEKIKKECFFFDV